MSCRRKPKRKPARLKDRAYYIRRLSERQGDNTRFFCAQDGARIAFDKATWAAYLLSSFAPFQKAAVVVSSRSGDDVPYQEWLNTILPAALPPEEYLAAVEQTMADRRAGREPSRRAVRAFLRQNS